MNFLQAGKIRQKYCIKIRKDSWKINIKYKKLEIQGASRPSF